MTSSERPVRSAFRLVLIAFISMVTCITSSWAEPVNKRKSPTAIVAVIHCEYSPVSFWNKATNAPSGFLVDIMDIVAARAGLQVSYICKNGWDDMITAVVSSEGDVSGLMKSKEREKILLFSVPIETSYLSFFARTQSNVDLAHLPSGHTVGVIKGSMSYEQMKDRPGVRLQIYGSYREGLFGLLAGEISLFAGEDSMVLKQMQEVRLEDRIRKVGKPFVERQRCLVVRKDSVQLFQVLDNILRDFVGGPEYQRVYLKWYGAPAPFWTNKKILTFSGVLLLITVIGMAAWRYASISRINRELMRTMAERKQADEQVRRSLKEKEVMLKEIHHRVKNNMQVIYSLLNLQAKGSADTAVRVILEESRDRVNSMALVHEKLYQSKNMASIDFKEYLQSLVLGIASTFKRHDVLVSVEMDSLALDVNVGIPCGLIVNELVSNSLKYAFPDGRTGAIKLGINKNSEGNHVLTVQDNGVGFPAEVDFRNTMSLGLKLVNVLTGQICGTIELLQAEGARFTITFPGNSHQEQKPG